MKTVFVLFAAAVFAMEGCSEPAKSVAYYQSHQSEIASKIADCAGKTGVANCDAAQTAAAIIQQQKWLAQPPKRGVW